ncbi:MAG: cytochrome c-type biogenesis protein CcmH [Rhizobiales bacterium]|nr:cytochrome c-type biogenesis protein CcmH [Hyphomicrobiales bacterium]
MKGLSRRLFLAFPVLVSSAARAVQPGEQLPDPAQEARARKLSGELRCLVCQNQSIDDSDAELARDLRRLVRERISAGESDNAIRQFLVARYGEFVLLRPPVNAKTVLLWSLPAIGLIAGAWIAASLFRKRARVAEAPVVPLSADEQAALDAMLKDRTPR